MRRIIEVIQQRKDSFALPTVGYVLIPPYPAQTFQNQIMDQEFEYQNGGDWDWYGIRAARIILQSHREQGMVALREISRKILRNRATSNGTTNMAILAGRQICAQELRLGFMCSS